MRPTDLLRVMPEGLYCPPADVFIDPVRPVARALITHGHSDHARAGHGAVLATAETLAIMAARYGQNFAGTTQAVAYGEAVAIKDVSFRFAPAGHVLGSAQIAVEKGPLRIVISGDYKRALDPTCAPFELMPCDVFVTEATFGLPVFRHPPLAEEVGKKQGKAFDPFDLICHVAFDRPPLSRKERAEQVSKRDAFAKYSEQARAVLNALLDKYADAGIESIEDIKILTLDPFTRLGTAQELIGAFGGKKAYLDAIRSLECDLYEVISA